MRIQQKITYKELILIKISLFNKQIAKTFSKYKV